ncbi:uncharacterized protein [Miscanthus floridulus]|uniref:uncharacterized protein n=1 Tax=Miscanthus floridulus TaxID=154761 RepID=UPI003459CD73
MEDSVGVEERREQSETTPHKKARQEVVEAGGVGGGKPGEEGGFLSAMASKIGATMSGTNGGSGGEVSATVASDGEEGKRDGNGNGEPGEEGGFLSAMASRIGAAMSGANGGSGDGGGANAAVASGGEDKEADSNGGGGIFWKLLHSSPPAAPQATGAMETEEVKDQDVAGEQAGILSAMATKIGMAMSGANGDDSRGDSGHDDAKTSNGEAVRGNNGEEKKGEEANGGGILSAVASKIGVAVSGANGNGNHSAEDDAKKSTGDAGHGGSKGEEKGRDVYGGRIVEQIISNLPSDDQAPDADEASLLIAIIED